jgi:hypothetical protein
MAAIAVPGECRAGAGCREHDADKRIYPEARAALLVLVVEFIVAFGLLTDVLATHPSAPSDDTSLAAANIKEKLRITALRGSLLQICNIRNP